MVCPVHGRIGELQKRQQTYLLVLPVNRELFASEQEDVVVVGAAKTAAGE
jgi:hypothetical protein